MDGLYFTDLKKINTPRNIDITQALYGSVYVGANNCTESSTIMKVNLAQFMGGRLLQDIPKV
jgi:hypothetical protein